MLGIEITQQAVFYGVVFGLIYAVFAAGFVLVYRATGVLNFAQGEIGAFGAAIFALFHVQYGVPYWLAFGFAIVATAVIGMVIELSVVRRLFDSPRLVLLIATVGVAQLLLFLRVSLPDIDGGGDVPVAVHRPVAADRLARRSCRARSSCSPSRPSAILALAVFMTQDTVRPRGASVGVERRHGARLRHQREAHVDDGVDDRRPRSRR